MRVTGPRAGYGSRCPARGGGEKAPPFSDCRKAGLL